MPPKRFDGKFGIQPSHPPESLLTSALYRLPDSVSPDFIENLTNEICAKANTQLERDGMPALSEAQMIVLGLKLARHYEDNGDAARIDMPTLIDAIVESPKFLNDDRGSITKLFEMHEMKTLQKIAELRRQRAEMTGNEEFNPYEALFETSSGNYYLARLLNMPHLELESGYMKHCVGTSTSYINKMRQGKVEIFSLRSKTTNLPVVTIEYDCKSHKLLKIKAQSDRIPSLSDDFAEDLIEAIEMLSGTVNDVGDMRIVESKEAPSLRRLLTLKVKAETQQKLSRDELCFLYEIEEPIQGFDGSREPLIETLRKDRNMDEDMSIIFECTKDQIAYSSKEINDETKAYVGPLFEGIFKKITHIEHIYTSFPEGKIHRQSLEIGGKNAKQLKTELIEAGFRIERSIELRMEFGEFKTEKEPRKIDIVRLKVRDLFPDSSYHSLDNIYKQAKELGLQLCPAETGLRFRLNYKEQPLDETLYLAMEPFNQHGNDPYILALIHDEEGLSLYKRYMKLTDMPGMHREFLFVSQ